MPLYEYGCPDCLFAWESLQARFDSPAPSCPQCGADGSERRVSTFAVVASPAMAPSRAPSGGCGTGDCACRRDVHQD